MKRCQEPLCPFSPSFSDPLASWENGSCNYHILAGGRDALETNLKTGPRQSQTKKPSTLRASVSAILRLSPLPAGFSLCFSLLGNVEFLGIGRAKLP